MKRTPSSQCHPHDFLHIDRPFKTNDLCTIQAIRTYTTKNTTTNDSDEFEQGHSPAYYEQYKRLFQYESTSFAPNNDQDQEKHVPKKSSNSNTMVNDNQYNVPKESNDNRLSNNGNSQVDTDNLDKPQLTHTDLSGKVKMVDVGQKPETKRTAKASGTIRLGKDAYQLVKENKMKKGDVLSVAQIAGIMAAKQTSCIIPLCHPIPITEVDVMLTLTDDFSVRIVSDVTCYGKSGVEMEALTAVTIAALTVYDMCKAVTHEMVICDIKLLRKEGGQRGTYNRMS